jgi:hypothetical protein
MARIVTGAGWTSNRAGLDAGATDGNDPGMSRTSLKCIALAASVAAVLVLPALALAGSFPLGKYTAKVKTPANLKGTWVLSFAKGGKYAISDNGTVVVRGHFTSTSKIRLSNETGPAACPQVGTYSWKRTGKTLRLTKVSDPCPGRATVLARPFTATG